MRDQASMVECKRLTIDNSDSNRFDIRWLNIACFEVVCHLFNRTAILELGFDFVLHGADTVWIDKPCIWQAVNRPGFAGGGFV